MASEDMAAGHGQRLSELRVVLLGGRNGGKSTVGNTILSQEEFVTKERTTCLRRLAQVAGRRLVVVDTPGWWCDFRARDTPELVKREIVCGVSLSLPGPHAILLVVKAGSAFTEKRRRAVEEHLGLLGESVWSHTVVLLTTGGRSQDTATEKHILREGEPLRWIVEKCGSRYHVLDITNGHGAAQVTELLEKIEEMVTGNGGRHFEMEREVLLEVEKRRRTVELKAQQRLVEVQRQRSILKGESRRLSDVRLVLLGARGSGKSSVGNTILAAGGGTGFGVGRRTARCVTGACEAARRWLTVVDTPGWWMNYFARDSPAHSKREVARSVFLCPPGPHALLLVVRADRAFTETYRRAVQEHLELLSQDAWTHTVVLFSFGDWLGDTTIEQHIESEGKALRWLVDRCGNRYHVLNNKSKGDGFQVTELLEKIEEMVAGNNGCHYNTDRKVFVEMEERRKAEEERANERLTRVQKQRKAIRAAMGQMQSPSVLRIMLTGGRHCGKSSTGNTILGREEFKVGSQATHSVARKGNVGGKRITVVDTPGWQSGSLDSTELIKQHLTDGDSFRAKGHGTFLLVVNVSSSFTRWGLAEAEAQLEAVGAAAWSRSMVLFTNGDWLGDTSVEQHIESEGDDLQELVERCACRYHVFNNKNGGGGAQVAELLEKIDEMVASEWLENRTKRNEMERTIVTRGLDLDGAVQHNVPEVPANCTDTLPHDVCEIGSSGEPRTLDFPASSCTSDQTPVVPRVRNGALARAAFGTAAGASAVVQISTRRRWHGGAAGGRVLVATVPEWLRPGHPERLDRSGSGPLALLMVIPAEQPMNGSRILVEPQEDPYHGQSIVLPQNLLPTTDRLFKERAFKEFVQSDGLQALIDQWGSSDIEELEAFIDSYFEMVWQDAMESAEQGSRTASSKGKVTAEAGQEVLSSIDRKLSKLDILEGMQRDLLDLKRCLERSSHIDQCFTCMAVPGSVRSSHSIQELRGNGRETHDPSASSGAREIEEERVCENDAS